MISRRQLIKASAGAALGAALSIPQAEAAGELLWSDEFTSDPGGAPDQRIYFPEGIHRGKWRRGELPWGGQPGPQEHQYYLPSQSRVANDVLWLEARKEPTGDRQWRSGIVHTRGLFSFLYGKIEVRAFYSAGKGMWPCIWLLRDTGGGPGTYEFNVIEAQGQAPDSTLHNYHWYTAPGKQGHRHAPYWVQHPPGWWWGWHVYALEWRRDFVSWSIDGVEVRRLTSAQAPICANSAHLIMDLSVGGWDGNVPDHTTPGVGVLAVDYVRVYR